MFRLALNVAAALSLLVCAAICFVWVRSFYVIENRTVLTSNATYMIGSGGGAIAIQRIERGDDDVRWMRPQIHFSLLTVEVISGRLNRRRPWTMLLMPYWVPAGVAAVLPMAWILARARREAKAAARRCPECGHDREPNEQCLACGFSATPPGVATPASRSTRTVESTV